MAFEVRPNLTPSHVVRGGCQGHDDEIIDVLFDSDHEEDGAHGDSHDEIHHDTEMGDRATISAVEPQPAQVPKSTKQANTLSNRWLMPSLAVISGLALLGILYYATHQKAKAEPTPVLRGQNGQRNVGVPRGLAQNNGIYGYPGAYSGSTGLYSQANYGYPPPYSILNTGYSS
jgi:hypothetical protein